MKITTIVTVYNLEAFVADAIESVLAQTRPSDEIIVVDDASTDTSPAVIARYGDRVRYVRQSQNGGALKNTLSGLRLAQGDLVAFLDGDDVWMPTKLAEIERLFLTDSSMVLASHQHVHVNETLAELAVYDATHRSIDRIMSRVPESEQSAALRHAILFRKGYWLGSAYVIRRSMLDLAEYERIIAQHAQTAFSYLDLTLGPFVVAANPLASVGMVNRRLFQYRQHGNNSCSTVSVASAQRGCKRARSTNQLTYALIRKYDIDGELKARYDAIDGEYELLDSQYRRDVWGALSQFTRSLPHLMRERKAAKESLRLVATLLVGPERFLKLKQT